MTLAETRALWAGAETDGKEASMSDAQLMELVLNRSARLERTLRRRDRRELVAAAVVLVLLAPALVVGPWITRAGVLLIAAGSGLIFMRLRRARALPAPRPDRPLAEALRAEHARVNAQVRLLETVAWWYLAPLAAGCVLVVGGVAGATLYTAAYAAAVLVVCAAVYWLNREALRRDLRPRRTELERQIEQLEA